MKKKHASLFNGIGGFQLAAEMIGWENVMSCEIDSYCNYVTKYQYSNCEQHHDIRKTDFTIYRGRIDILTGGFPCQPFSVAGKQLGTDDDRHLWPEMLRAIREIQPRWVVGENVPGIINWNGGLVFEQVQADLEAEGYEVQPFVLPACAVNAPHRRDRVWLVAYDTTSDRRQRQGAEVKNENRQKRSEEDRELEGRFERFCSNGANPNTTNAGIESMQQPENGVHGSGSVAHSRLQRSKVPEQHSMGDQQLRQSGITTHAEGDRDRGGLRKLEGEDGEVREPEEYGKNNTEFRNDGKKRDASNASRSGREQLNIPKKSDKQRYSSWGNNEEPTDWTDFPTQSPVCNGNDGLPAELVRQRIREDSMGYLSEKEIDKIISKAHTKWRDETIKAGGNAIVWQVAFQIFKAIEQYEWQC